MRVLAASDLHGDHAIYEWLVESAGLLRPEVLVLAGDLLGYPDGYGTMEDAQRADAAQIVAALHMVSPPVLYIMGNDDLVELGATGPAIRSIHGARVEVSDINFVGYQYSLPFMGGVYEKSEEEIRQDLAGIETLVDRHTVLVTHSPAYGVLDVGVGDEYAGSKAIRELIQRRNPLVHIHGHIHREFGRRGRHFNVAAAGHRRALLIDTDTLDHEVLDSGQVR